MSTTDEVCFLRMEDDRYSIDDFVSCHRKFQNNFENYGFNFIGISNLIQSAKPNTVGIIGSYTFKHISELLGVKTHKWDNEPSDIDICITNEETFRNFILYFRRRGYDIEYEFEKIHEYSITMSDVDKVVNVRQNLTSTKYIQLILLNCKTVEEHLRNVDFDFTRVAYTNEGFMYLGNAIESISSRKCKFPSSFNSIKQFNKTWKRSIKYIGRGIEFEYPDVIDINGYSIYLPECEIEGDMYDKNIYCDRLTRDRLTLVKKVTVTRVVSPEEKLKQITEIVSSEEIESLKKQISERDLEIITLKEKLHYEQDVSKNIKDELDKIKQKLSNLKTSIVKQFDNVHEQSNGWYGDCGWDEDDNVGW